MKHASLLGRRLGPRLDFLGRRVLIRFTAVAAAFPLVALANFYLFVCLSRIDLGHWPVFNDPYPRVLPSAFQRISIFLSFMAVPAVSVAGVLSSVIGRRRYADFPMWRLLAFNVASAGLLVMLARMDPGSFWNWFVD
jgi:hypothetical protein